MSEEVQETSKLTPEQISEAEQLLRMANLCKMRTDHAGHAANIQKALEAAPLYPDAVIEQYKLLKAARKSKEASELLSQARAAHPEHVELERIFAESLLVGMAYQDFEQNFADAGSYASSRAAQILTLICPGLGHLSVEQYPKGGTLLTIWIVSLAIIVAIPQGLNGIIGMFQSRPEVAFNPMMIVPLLGAIMTYIYAITDISAIAKHRTPPKIDRPIPPSDLPFEP